MALNADRARQAKEALSLKHTYMYMFGMSMFKSGYRGPRCRINANYLRSDAAGQGGEEILQIVEISARLARVDEPVGCRLELAPDHAAEVGLV
jgi:hypothetical protein